MLHAVEIGHFALVLALGAVLIQSVVLWAGTPNAVALGGRAAQLTCLFIALSFAMLVLAFMRSDFSVALVAAHSHSLKPLLYKIAGVWGNHEGSMLLWVLILALFGAGMTARLMRAETQAERRILAYALAVQGLVTLAFLVLILFTSNPFLRLIALPDDGNGLNPILQDIGLALHPPMLYLGYVGLSVGFAFAVGALIQSRADALWARLARPWIVLAWTALTAGIALGSWWAYYELGWGGWWFWDPVENASLMPWLVATALIHSLNVVEKRGMFASWTLLLAILGFGLSLIGTFIVRSGLLTSVHAFTNDPRRGLVILFLIVLAVGVPLVLYAWRGGRIGEADSPDDAPDAPALFSRETALQANNLLLVVAAASVLIGTLYPLILEAITGARISVGAPFFEASVAPIFALMLVLLPMAPLMAWKRARASYVWGQMRMALLLIVLGLGGLALMLAGVSGIALATIGLGLWVFAGVVMDIYAGLGMGGGRGINWRRLRAMPAPRLAMNCAHLGVAVFTLGVAGVSFFDDEIVARMRVGEAVTLGDARFTLMQVAPMQGANYTATTAQVNMTRAAHTTPLISEIRSFPVARSQTTEAAIQSSWRGDYYVVFGGGNADEGFVIRIYKKPLITWIWGGAGLMVLGGLLAFFAQRKTREICDRD